MEPPFRRCSVHVRVRGLGSGDAKTASPLLGQWGSFTVDGVHEGDAQAFFNATVRPLVLGEFLQGYSTVVLAYGAPQSGKSYLLEGPRPPTPSVDDGVIPRAVSLVFAKLSAVPKHRYQLLASACGLSAGPDAAMLDLLDGNVLIASLKDAVCSNMWAKLSKLPLVDEVAIHQVLATARQAASRSGRTLHTCVTLHLVAAGLGGDSLQPVVAFVELIAPDARDQLGRPSIPDPALSRCVSLGHSSLTAVVAVLKQLRAARDGVPGAGGGRPTGHIPWRDSPLTRWLQQPLSRCRELMVLAAVSPSPQAAAETLATLSYVAKLRSGGRQEGVQVTATWEGGVPGAKASAVVAARTPAPAQSPLVTRPSSRPKSRQSVSSTTSKSFLDMRAAGSRSPARAPGPTKGQSVSLTAGRQSMSPGESAFAFGRSALEGGGELLNKGRDDDAASLGGKSVSLYPSPSSPRAGTATPPAPPRVLTTSAAGLQRASSSPRAKSPPTGTPRTPAAAASMELSLRPAWGRPSGASPPRPTSRASLSRSPSRASSVSPERRRSGSRSQAGAVVTVPPALSPSKSAQQNALSAYLTILQALKQTTGVQKLHAEAQLEYLYAAVIAQDAQGRGRSSDSRTAALEKLVLQLQLQLESAQRKMSRQATEQREFTAEIQRLGDASLSAATELEWQAQEATLMRQLATTQDELITARAALDDALLQLAESRIAADDLRAAKERAEHGLAVEVEKMQDQISALTEEAARLRLRATEALASTEGETATRRALELQLDKALSAAEARQAALVAAQQSVGALKAQLEEANSLLESTRAERTSEQAARWAAEEASQRLAGKLDEAVTERQQADMERAAIADRADADAAASAATIKTLQSNLSTANGQVQALKSQVVQLSSAHEDLKRDGSGAVRDLKDTEMMLKEFERDLEVHLPAVWLDMRSDRSDALILSHDRSGLSVAGRWRPVLRALMDALRKAAVDTKRLQDAHATLQHQAALTESKVAQVDELSAHLKAQQEAQVEALTQLAAVKRQLAETEARLTKSEAEREHAVSTASSQGQVLQHKLHTRDHMFGIVWGEVLNMRAAVNATAYPSAKYSSPGAGTGGAGSPRRKTFMEQLQEPLPTAGGAAGGWGPAGLPSGGRSDGSAMDWGDPATQQRVITTTAQVRIQICTMQAGLADCQRRIQDQALSCARAEQEAQAAKAAHGRAQAALAASEARVSDLSASLSQIQGSVKQLDGINAELAATQSARDALKAQVSTLELQVQEHRREVKEAKLVAAADQAARLDADRELASASGRVRRLEAQLADAQQQVAASAARLDATEKALLEANARVSELGSKLALTDTDTRLKFTELQSRLTVAEAGASEAAIALVAARQAADRSDGSDEEVAQLRQVLQQAQDDRLAVQQMLDGARADLRQAQAQAQDAAFTRTQLHAVAVERDELRDEIRHAKAAVQSATLEKNVLRQELEATRSELHRATADRLQLAAQLEAAKLDSFVSHALARSKAVHAEDMFATTTSCSSKASAVPQAPAPVVSAYTWQDLAPAPFRPTPTPTSKSTAALATPAVSGSILAYRPGSPAHSSLVIPGLTGVLGASGRMTTYAPLSASGAI